MGSMYGLRRAAPEVVARIHARQFAGREIGDRAPGIRRALKRRIVVHDDDAVAREVDVELEAVGAAAMPASNAASVFSGASALPPRCANTSGREAAKNGCRASATGHQFG